ncbi:unnamed protein product [Diplocarpon coronariae]
MTHSPNTVTRLTLGFRDSELARELLRFPILQDLDVKGSFNSRQIQPSQPQIQYIEAAMVQARGVEASTPCTRCSRHVGPFLTCKHMVPVRRSVVDTVIDKLFLNGACANCYFDRKGAQCSLRKAHEKQYGVKVNYNRKKDENGKYRKKRSADPSSKLRQNPLLRAGLFNTNINSATMVLRSSGGATVRA